MFSMLKLKSLPVLPCDRLILFMSVMFHLMVVRGLVVGKFLFTNLAITIGIYT